jgi:four helix bundle protein
VTGSNTRNRKRKNMSYKKLDIWERARKVSIAIHKMILKELDKFEMYEEGSQIRRSSKSVRSNIVEGYGRRRYVNEYIRFFTFSIASNDETIDHLETLFETGSLKNKTLYDDLHEQIEILGKKLNLFIQSIERNIHKPPATNNQQPVTSDK